MQPGPLAQAVIDLIVRTLPPEHRRRYALEMYADLYGLPRAEQRREIVSFVLHAQQLAWALADVAPDLDWKPPARRDLRCVMHLHRYVRRHNLDAVGVKFYLECVRCRNTRHIPAPEIRAWAGPQPPPSP